LFQYNNLFFFFLFSLSSLSLYIYYYNRKMYKVLIIWLLYLLLFINSFILVLKNFLFFFAHYNIVSFTIEYSLFLNLLYLAYNKTKRRSHVIIIIFFKKKRNDSVISNYVYLLSCIFLKKKTKIKGTF